jgi:hypothetical protein
MSESVAEVLLWLIIFLGERGKEEERELKHIPSVTIN